MVIRFGTVGIMHTLGMADYPRRLLYGTERVVETHKKHGQEVQQNELLADQTKRALNI